MASEFLNPQQIINKLKLSRDMSAADFGSGSGVWVLILAKILEDGIVYAIDILEPPLSALRGRIQIGKINNIKIIRSNVENANGSTLPDSSVDLVLMTNLLFQCESKDNVMVEGKRVLKKGGKILVVDWLKDNPLTKELAETSSHLASRSAQPNSTIEYVSFDEIKKICKELGLKLEKEFEAGVYHQGLIFEK